MATKLALATQRRDSPLSRADSTGPAPVKVFLSPLKSAQVIVLRWAGREEPADIIASAARVFPEVSARRKELWCLGGVARKGSAPVLTRKKMT